MKKYLWHFMLVSGIASAVFCCASTLVTGVPQGSVLIGVYKGSFNGVFNEGSVEVKLYQSPDGSKLFYGNLGQDGSYVNFEGEMKEGELQGEILLPLEGTIAGKLSSDGKSLSGSYKFTVPPFDHGTWNAHQE